MLTSPHAQSAASILCGLGPPPDGDGDAPTQSWPVRGAFMLVAGSKKDGRSILYEGGNAAESQRPTGGDGMSRRGGFRS